MKDKEEKNLQFVLRYYRKSQATVSRIISKGYGYSHPA